MRKPWPLENTEARVKVLGTLAKISNFGEKAFERGLKGKMSHSGEEKREGVPRV